MQWFIKEQVEEVATMNDLLTVVGATKTSRTSRSTSPASRAATGHPTPRVAGV